MMQISTEKFTGPLDLLLKLIEKEELDITEVSLAKIADQYINNIRKTDLIDVDQTADFLLVAAKLLYIKSKALLPYLIIDDEEEDVDELEKQLKMYKEFLLATEKIEKIITQKKFMFSREFNRQAIFNNVNFFSPPLKLKADDLASVFQDILRSFVPLVNKLEEEKLEHKINIEDKIMLIQKLLLNKIKFSFNQVMNGATTKTEVIVSFLAMLELSKQRELVIEQEGLFSDIFISK